MSINNIPIALLGFGINLFDMDMICGKEGEEDLPDFCDMNDVLYEIVESEEFISFAQKNKVLIKKWEEEDQDQIWLVAEGLYFERSHFEEIKTDIEEESITSYLEIVKNYLFNKFEEKTGYSISYNDTEPKWMMGLYYK